MTESLNFYETWKEYYSKYTNLLDEKMTKEFPSQWIGQLLEMNLQFKKMVNETTERYFESVNLPSKNDLAHISAQIVNLDAKVDDIEEFVQESIDNQGDLVTRRNDLANLKKDMKSLDNKLNHIINLLNSPSIIKTNNS
ncbi:hypothetical protein IEC97_00785 [Neobacillus cucumis]|uniref:hypothetical protein n=1 Tax=Neobacillus cucumis TaxID=1740721 RepID=UPI0018DFA3F9|nr:hypothetical protein [Neobacillus cucumis]MBI0575879.1 hypothetical protein [Neobacillus cucumis]